MARSFPADVEGQQDLPVPPDRVTISIEGWNATDLHSREIFERSLRSVASQTFPVRRCEILIVIDAGLDPDSDAWIRDLLPEARIIRLPDATYYRSKNAALEAAKGDYLVCADSDVVYEPQWLAAMLASLQAGEDLVTGNTRYRPGFLSRTLNLCDWAATRRASGYTDWFYCNNLGMPRRTFETVRFREDVGPNGMGSVNLVRYELAGRGMRFWFAAEARGHHHLWPFLRDRLSYGGYQVHFRRLAPDTPWTWLLRVPLLGPFFIIGGALLKAWGRAWRLRSTLPARGLSLPGYVAAIALVKAVELAGALMVAWAPGWVDRHYGWFDLVVRTASPAAVE